jgi:uroporphyrinogen-III synthase
MKHLTNLSFLVTRPEHQAQDLIWLLEKLGGTCILFPTLTITPLPANITAAQLSGRVDKVIFTSANAVSPVMPHWQDIQADAVFAIGPGTANALAEFSIDAQQPADQQFNSEGLLALPALGDVAGQRIVIFSGEGGRALLLETLQQRGAQVEKIAVYRREVATPTQPLPELKNIDLIISTSGESLTALTQLYAASTNELRQRPLLVISPTMAVLAQELGFSGEIIVAENSSDAAIVEAILAWRSDT